jgi:hypothetical protein
MSLVQSEYGSANPSTSQQIILPTNVAVGDFIEVMYRGVDSVPGVSDNLGNAYTRRAATGDAGFTAHECVVSVAGACTITVTQASGRIGVSVHHHDGMDAVPFDVATDVNTGTAVSSATDAFTTAIANEVVIGMWGGNVAPTPEGDYTLLEGNTTGRLFTAHRIATAVLTGETVDWTHASATFLVRAMAYKEAAAAGGIVRHMLQHHR